MVAYSRRGWHGCKPTTRHGCQHGLFGHTIHTGQNGPDPRRRAVAGWKIRGHARRCPASSAPCLCRASDAPYPCSYRPNGSWPRSAACSATAAGAAPPPTPAASFAFRPPPPVAPPAPPPLPTPAAWAEMQTAPAEFPRVHYAAPATYQTFHQVLDSYDKGRISKTQANAILGAKFNWAQAQASGPEWKTATHWAPNPAGLLGGYTKDSPWE